MCDETTAGVLTTDAPLAGCCGLYCGLCPRYQSKAASRCLGCHAGEQHAYCSVWRCCVAKRGLTTCAECEEYLCERLKRAIGVDIELDSFVSHRPALPNLERIRALGLEAHLDGQRARRLLAEELLEHYNDGRSMTFYCTACALMPVDMVRGAIDAFREPDGAKPVDVHAHKARAKAVRAAVQRRATDAGLDLRLRKKRR